VSGSEENREAVLAVQGGGIWAFSMLGQAKAVVEAGYIPLAIAGTSGGAILAALLWSGLEPGDIELAFLELLHEDPHALLELLGEFDPAPARFDYASFTALKAELQSVVSEIGAIGDRRWMGRKISGLRWASRASALWTSIKTHIDNRGLFRGNALESKLNTLIRRGLKLPASDELVTFGDVERLMAAGRGRLFRPVLLLTATNLSRRRLELISSADPDYADVPVAAAVRASAGFPVFFRPRELPDSPGGGWFVDGGVIANFPIWTFSSAFRDKLQGHPVYHSLASRPWLRIGLGIVDDTPKPRDVSAPPAFLSALLGMVTGIARNQLEDALAVAAPRTLVLRQPVATAGAPVSILDVPSIDAVRIKDMVERGYRHARDEIARMDSPAVSKQLDQAAIQSELASLVNSCKIVFQADGEAVKFRANVFLPKGSGMRMVASYNMDGDPDDGLVFRDQATGSTGSCYQTHSAIVCNLATVAAAAVKIESGRATPYRMDAQLQGKIRFDRTWLASMPVFDPFELNVHRRRAVNLAPEQRVAMVEHPVSLDGPILAILNLDAAFDYERLRLESEPVLQADDPRIVAILDIMEARTLKIGHLMTIVPNPR
jgi:predicted acylesterase/phospholipase RssA